MLMQSRHAALVSAVLVLYVTVRRLAGILETSVVLKLRSAGWFQTFGNIFTVCNVINLYCAVGKIKKNEMGWACGAYGEGRGVHRVLVEKPEGRRPLGRPRRRWEDNIKVCLQEVGGVVGI
jgi:hypothetical protein